jgi:hypothetical protein
MPPAKVKPSDVAAEAKKTYIPYIESKFPEQWPAHSYLIPESTRMRCEPPAQPLRCRMSKYMTLYYKINSYMTQLPYRAIRLMLHWS